MKSIEKLRKLILTEIEDGRLEGASISLLRPGKLHFTESYGSYRSNSIFRIYSMTKVITSVAILLLIEQGRLKLETPVSYYFPGFKNRRVVDKDGRLVLAQKAITIQDLLNMTSGLCYGVNGGSVGEQSWYDMEQAIMKEGQSGRRFTSEELINRMGSAIGNFEPGTAWEYGAGADILGGIAECVTGMLYEQFLKKELLDPLEMEETGFWISPEEVERIAPMYTRDAVTAKVSRISTKITNQMDMEAITVPNPHIIRTCRPMFISAGGGLYSTIQDYEHLTEMLLAGGVYRERRILQEKTVNFMSRNQLTGEMLEKVYRTSVGKAIKGYGYSNLVRIMIAPEKAEYLGNTGTVGEFGWDGMPGNYFLVDREKQLSVIFMIQVVEGADLPFRAKLRKTIYDNLI